MSRSGYTEDCDGWALIRWRGAVKAAIRGKRGQSFLREMLASLDAMPEKRLITDELEATAEDGECEGGVCAIGAVGQSRGIDMTAIDTYEHDDLGKAFGIARALAQEIMYENDDCSWGNESPEQRWERMRRWVVSCLPKENGEVSHNTTKS